MATILRYLRGGSTLALLILLSPIALSAETKPGFGRMDVFELEWASSPQISPDGQRVLYRRNSMDVMTDRSTGRLWIVDADGRNNIPLTGADSAESGGVWSPGGTRIAYTRSTDNGSEIHLYWLAAGKSARLTQLDRSPRDLSWSPDGSSIEFSMLVAEDPPVIVSAPKKPKDAEWADAPRVTTRLKYERDGSGYIETGYNHYFVVPAEGGTAHQVTSGPFHHTGWPSWSADGTALIFSGNRNEDWEHAFANSEVYSVAIEDGEVIALTDRNGPDASPLVSPDGRTIAYLGYEDKVRAYQVTRLQVMNADGSGKRELLADLDRSISGLAWSADSKGLYFQYDHHGDTHIGYTTLDGRQREVATIEELWYEASTDGRKIQGWLAKPPGFDPDNEYPLLVENHGGPISNYGARFSPEIQLYAAAGYVVFYPNPRGSTSYGEAFGDLLFNNYPGDDYQDVMDGVDYLIAEGLASEDQLYVTGGSAGGIMTAWMIGKSNRFRSAAVIKPILNWMSKTLTADNYYAYANYRYPGQPWENPLGYLKFSPITLVGNIQTPTLVMVGTADQRTPISEAKQLYNALKLRRIDTALVEVPGAPHNIAGRPSQLITKVDHILAWFEKYRSTPEAAASN